MLGAKAPATGRTFDVLILALDRLGGVAADSGDPAAARQAYTELERLALENKGADHWRTADARRSLAELKLIEPLSEAQKKRLSDASRLMERAERLDLDGKAAEALPLVADALKVRRELLGTKHRAYVLSAYRLARLYNTLDNAARAEEILHQLEPSAAQSVGTDHPDHVRMLADLAFTYVDLEEYERAEPLLRRALALASGVLDDDNAYTKAIRERLGETLDAEVECAIEQGDYPRAIRLRRDLERFKSEWFGAGHWQARDARLKRDELGRYAQLGPGPRSRIDAADQALSELQGLTRDRKWGEARDAAQRALAVYGELLKPDGPRYINSLYWIAVIERDSSTPAVADAAFRRADEAMGRVLGADDPDHVSLLLYYGRARLAAGDETHGEILVRACATAGRAGLRQGEPRVRPSVSGTGQLARAPRKQAGRGRSVRGCSANRARGRGAHRG